MSRTAPKIEASGLSCDELYERIQTDNHDMLDFIRAEGKTVPEALRAKVTELCYGTTETTAPAPVIPTPAGGAGPVPTPETDKVDSNAESRHPALSLALEVHGALSQLVAPATPRTIRASRSTGKLKFVADNITVKFLLLVSIISLLGFFAAALVSVPAKQAEKVAAATTNAQAAALSNAVAASLPEGPIGAPQDRSKLNAPVPHAASWSEIFMLFAAASLGSAFYGLYTGHKYLVNCTFDPKYHQVYLIRYVLGLTSGTILGFFGRDFLKDDTDISKQLGIAVLALIGGYAAEAVSQILQRFAETLVTIVRGSNADVLLAKQEELKAKAKQQETETRTELVKGLTKAKEVAIATGGAGSEVAKEIQKTVDSLSK